MDFETLFHRRAEAGVDAHLNTEQQFVEGVRIGPGRSCLEGALSQAANLRKSARLHAGIGWIVQDVIDILNDPFSFVLFA